MEGLVLTKLLSNQVGTKSNFYGEMAVSKIIGLLSDGPSYFLSSNRWMLDEHFFFLLPCPVKTQTNCNTHWQRYYIARQNTLNCVRSKFWKSFGVFVHRGDTSSLPHSGTIMRADILLLLHIQEWWKWQFGFITLLSQMDDSISDWKWHSVKFWILPFHFQIICERNVGKRHLAACFMN